MKRKFSVFILSALLLQSLIYSQVKVKELFSSSDKKDFTSLLDESGTRTIYPLDKNWNVYLEDEPLKKSRTSIPSFFTGTETIVYEKYLDLPTETINNKNIRLVLFGVNYSAEILLNNLVIHKHQGGDFPFKITLPKDLLKTKSKNILSIKISKHLSSDATIPVEQRFLFPENYGGLIRDVYLEVTQRSFISDFEYDYRILPSGSTTLQVQTKIINQISKLKTDSSSSDNNFSFRVKLISPNGTEFYSQSPQALQLPSVKEKTYSTTIELSNLELWSPELPRSYKIIAQLLRNDVVIDEEVKSVSFYSLLIDKEKILLNGNNFSFNGVTYVPSYAEDGTLASFEAMQRDIKIIKSTGFNAVRFTKSTAHPYMLKLCENAGLLALIELPLNGIPEEICAKNNFRERVRSFLIPFLKAYKNYSIVAAIGLGGSYLGNSSEHAAFLNEIADLTKKICFKPAYASFIGFNINPIDNIDLYGVELYNIQIDDYRTRVENLEQKLGLGKVFISEATYSTCLGSTDGYLNQYSLEAQAKFFSDLLDFEIDNNRAGYFLNSAFDYKGDYPAFSSGYNGKHLYLIGILDEYRGTTRLSQKVIYSKLHNSDKVTIPIGTKKDDAPFVFIITGSVLALMLAFIANSKRKFREDALRALFRPYNFFSDVRDQRILAGFHSNFLLFLLSGTSSLLLSNLLFYFRGSQFFEKLLISFGIPSLVEAASFLAWNPVYSVVWLFVVSLLFFLVITFLVKIASLFVRNKVFFSSVYFTVTWSFLPLLVLLPAGLVLYRILEAELITIYILIGLIIFTVWIFYRLMKGIYVIFDVRPATVYFYSLLFIIVVTGIVLLYFQLSNSTVYYILNAYKQFKLM
ncbi:MAG: hypothetical protein C4539_03470 [Ignavibacteriales bacterium]|nr:MAG: hypothetical protein C4539_03470 [Ignavibacteriales bacterium]